MRGRKAFGIAAVAVGVSFAGRARAEALRAANTAGAREGEGTELVSKERPTRRVFYGWEILATGEVAAVVVGASVLLPDKPLDSLFSSAGFVIGMPTYLLAGPVIHWSHDNFSKGLVSFGSNAVFALAGGLIGQAVRCAPSDADAECGSRGFFTGLSVGAVVAPLIDAVALGWEDVPLEDSLNGDVARRVRATRATGVHWGPTWNLGPRGAFALGIAGRF